MLRRLFKDTAIYGFSPYVPKIASFFILPLITQHLTPFDYAVSGLVSAYTAAISVFATLGLRVVLVNWFYKAPIQYKWAWRQVYGFLTLWSIPFAFLTGLLIYIGTPEGARDNLWSIILLNVFPVVSFAGTSIIAASYYQSTRQPLQIGIRTIVFGTLTVLLNWYTISILRMGYMGWFWSAFVVSMLHNASFWYPVNVKLGIKPILNFKWRFIKKSLKVSLPTVPHYYSSYLLNISDRVVMSQLKVPVNDIGRYNLSYMIGNYVQMAGNASGLAINPIMYECYKRNDDYGARNLVFLLQTIFLAGTFLLSLWMREFFHVMIRNESLANLYPLAVIIIMSYNYRPMYFGANLKLMYLDKTNKLWRVTFAAGIMNVILNLCLIPFFGYQAAAVVTFISFMYMGYAGYFSSSFRNNNAANFHPVLWLLLTTLTSVAAYFCVEVSINYKFIITIVICFFLIGLYRKYKHLIGK